MRRPHTRQGLGLPDWLLVALWLALPFACGLWLFVTQGG